jgi:hypothetical protein
LFAFFNDPVEELGSLTFRVFLRKGESRIGVLRVVETRVSGDHRALRSEGVFYFP